MEDKKVEDFNDEWCYIDLKSTLIAQLEESAGILAQLVTQEIKSTEKQLKKISRI